MNEGYHSFGVKALERMAEATSFNSWMYETISPYIKGNILEIGSGIGNISTFFVAANQTITLSDIDEGELRILKERFSNAATVKDILKINLINPNFKREFAYLANTFDAVFLLNVLEHIEDDTLAIKHCRYLLKEGGTLVILVPAYRFLFSRMDKELGHYRRYTKASLSKVIAENNFRIEKAFYFNTLGIAGWWWNKVFNKAEISSGKMSIFDRLVPMAKLMDKLCFHTIGLSAIVVAKKN